MKTLKLIVVGMMLILASGMQGQLSVRVNIGAPPEWGPAGYAEARYYYLPDIECYYDVHHSSFIYYLGNRWVHSRYLPARYRDYDLYGGYKVVMNDYRGNAPYAHFREHRMKYARGYRGYDQRNMGERHDGRGGERRDYQQNRMDNHGNGRGPERNYSQNNRRDYNQNNGQMNYQRQDRGNDKMKAQKNDNGRGHGNNQGNDRNEKGDHGNGR